MLGFVVWVVGLVAGAVSVSSVCYVLAVSSGASGVCSGVVFSGSVVVSSVGCVSVSAGAVGVSSDGSGVTVGSVLSSGLAVWTAALAAGSGVLGSSAFGWPQAVSVSAMLNVRPYISAFLMVCSSFVRFLNGSAPGVGPSRQNTQEIFSTYHYFFNLSPGCFKIKAVWKDRGIVYFSTCRRHDVKIRAYTGNVK